MSFGEIALSLIGGFLALAFGLWARRLDKALDLLEKIQEEMHRWARETEHRITKLEAAARYCGASRYEDDGGDDR